MKIKPNKTIKFANSDPCLASCYFLIEDKDIEVDDNTAKEIIKYGHGKQVSIAEKIVKKVIKTKTKKVRS